MTISYYTSKRPAGVCYDKYTPELLQSYPNYLFVFGDNNHRIGKGGQAIIRDEPNAIGLTTKRSPSHNMDAYMTGTLADYNAVNADIDRIESYLLEGKHVIFPASGVGTGLAALHVHAPNLLIHINNRISKIIGANYEIIYSHLR